LIPAVALLLACGTDFVEPAPVAATADKPVLKATVFRVIPVAPQATLTPLPAVVGPIGSTQRPFPAEIDPSRTSTQLVSDDVIDFWTEYLSDTRLIVDGRPVDIHICADGRLLPGAPSTVFAAGTWGFEPPAGDWYEVILGREFRRGRISGIVTLSRVGASTVAVDEGLNVVSVTDSDLCAAIGGFHSDNKRGIEHYRTA
jgi:hypothetical protein